MGVAAGADDRRERQDDHPRTLLFGVNTPVSLPSRSITAPSSRTAVSRTFGRPLASSKIVRARTHSASARSVSDSPSSSDRRGSERPRGRLYLRRAAEHVPRLEHTGRHRARVRGAVPDWGEPTDGSSNGHPRHRPIRFGRHLPVTDRGSPEMEERTRGSPGAPRWRAIADPASPAVATAEDRAEARSSV